VETNVVVEAPLSGQQEQEVIGLPPPCTYCGKQVAAPGAREWERTFTYILKEWYRHHTGTMRLRAKAVDGKPAKGSVTVHAPYCAEHAKGIILFTVGQVIGISVATIGAVATFLRIYDRLGAGLWDEPQDLLLIGGLLFAFMLGGVFLMWVINSLIARIKPEFRDYPKMGTGHWGLWAGPVRVDHDRPGDPIRYSLRLGFLNVESARRFLVAYPQAQVTRGEELVGE